MQTQAFVF